jgi:glycosyltransferase involved in cell wall biosynthesis
MKIAYFSPLLPKKTGIARYSNHLLPYLAAKAEVDVFEHGVQAPHGLQIFDYVKNPNCLSQLMSYDARVYHIGNNPEFHLPIYKTLLKYPGIVVLHDAVIYYLIAGLKPWKMMREFARNYGWRRIMEYFKIVHDSPMKNPLRYPYPERYPFLQQILESATGIIVHSSTTQRKLIDMGYLGPTAVIPHLIYPEMVKSTTASDQVALRQKLGLIKNEMLIGSLGFIGRTKRMESAIKALAELKGQLAFKFLIVGEGDDLQALLKQYGLLEKTIKIGFASDEEFNAYLAACDIVINLRYPSMGECSGTLIQAMSYGKACIVTDHAWFSELPDNAVYKIGYKENEIKELKQAILHLADANNRQAYEQAATHYVQDNCMPTVVAERYIQALTTMKKAEKNDRSWAKRYLNERVDKALRF